MVAISFDDATRDRYRGALLGLACGDAVGTTVEFSPPGSFPPVTDMVGGGPFGLSAGAWTDDTSMALCLAESLVERQGFDPIDQLSRYVRWWREGYLSSTGRCFDIGGQTRRALSRFVETREAYPGDHWLDGAGNGALMRLAPVPLAFAGVSALAIEHAGLSSRTTHGAPQSTDACRWFAALLVAALHGAKKDAVLARRQGLGQSIDIEHLLPEVRTVVIGSFREKQPPAIRGGGYVVAALEAALWAVHSTASFEEAVLAATNLGDDADTTAAITGQLAGALYGATSFPPRWLDKLSMRSRIVELAEGLFKLAGSADGPAVAEHLRPSGVGVVRRPSADDARAKPDAPPGDSYWVVPGKLLAGPYPGARSRAEAEAKLKAFLELGVTCFIDLTEEGEGPPLHPYAGLLRQLTDAQRLRTTYLRIPIRDIDVPAVWLMSVIQKTIRTALDAGEVVYVHCWGGVGRTGTVVGCYLVDEGEEANAVIERIVSLRHGTMRSKRVSPETEAQRRMILSWAALAPDNSSSEVPDRLKRDGR